MFNNKDLMFFSAILSFEKILEKAHEKTFDLEFNFDFELIKKGMVEVKNKNKKEINKLFQIGKYDDNKEIFTWFELTREFMISLIPKDKKIKETFLNGFAETFEKLCSKSEIKIKKEFRNVIPYLIVILIHPYNLFRATTNEKPEETTYFAINLGLTKALVGEFMKILKKFQPLLFLSRTKKVSKKSSKNKKKKNTKK
jgi:hypothetical protein